MGGNDKPGEPGDPKVKDLIQSGAPLEEAVDAATAEALQRWFALPSYESLRDKPPQEADPEASAAAERRALAVAAVDPALIEAIVRRHDSPDVMLVFRPSLELRADPSCARTDYTMIDRLHAVGEPRAVEIPPQLEDDLRECTPQALLRDLHRAELDFEKVFEMVDAAAEQRFDVVAAVKHAMTTSWKLPELGGSPFRAAATLITELRDERRKPWTDIPLPDRRRVQD